MKLKSNITEDQFYSMQRMFWLLQNLNLSTYSVYLLANHIDFPEEEHASYKVNQHNVVKIYSADSIQNYNDW